MWKVVANTTAAILVLESLTAPLWAQGNFMPAMMVPLRGGHSVPPPQPADVFAPTLELAPTAPKPARTDGSSGRSASRNATSPASTQSGTAVWNELRGPTASGEAANPEGFTAGHRSLPFGTIVRVTSGATGKSVVVRINDRPARKTKFLLDMSRASARAIGLTGTARVVLDVEQVGRAGTVGAGLRDGRVSEGRSARPGP